MSYCRVATFRETLTVWSKTPGERITLTIDAMSAKTPSDAVDTQMDGLLLSSQRSHIDV